MINIKINVTPRKDKGIHIYFLCRGDEGISSGQ
jgi:hypothetical protein